MIPEPRAHFHMNIGKVLIALVIAYVSFKLSLSITNELIQFEKGLGSIIINLFFLLPLYLIVLLGLTGLIGFGTWNILNYIISSDTHTENNKKQPKNTTATHPNPNPQPKTKPSSISGLLGKTLLGILGMIGLALFIIILGLAGFSIMGESLKKLNQSQFEKKFDTVHPNTNYSVAEYNIKATEVAATDYRFIYYLKELNIASENFVYADEVIDIFEADVKRSFAIACMRDVLIEKVANTSFVTMTGYKMNALNAIGNKRRAMKNVTLMDKGSSVYNYPKSSGYDSYILDKEYGDRCNETMTVDDMFDKYLPIYLKNKKIDADKTQQSKNKGQTRYSTKLYAWIDKLYKREMFKKIN